MISSNKKIYIQETEIKPNKYVTSVLIFCLFIIVVCWITNELGFFRVGDTEMRVGSIITIVVTVLPLLVRFIYPKSTGEPYLKYIFLAASSIFTFAVNVLMGFHTTIMLLFPIFMCMLYRAKKMGWIATFVSIFCAMFCPIIGYLIGTWDVPLFQELILIATNGTAEIVGAYEGLSLLNIGKILLYISFPRSLMVGAFSILMFNIIAIGADHVNNQILLNEISHKDNLTGLYNQNYFDKIKKDPSNSGTAGVIFFDVNGLKYVNDNFGHEQGDLLLKRSALSLIKCCDYKSSYPFRIGGDEFIIVVENATEERVNDIINNWNAVIYSINAENERLGNGIKCSVAMGYAVGDYSKLDELVGRADEQMYNNKKQMPKSKGSFD